MRRFFLYLPVGSITFVFGVGAIFLVMTASLGQSTDVPQISEVNQGPESATIPVTEPESVDSDKSDICSGLDTSDYQEPAIRKWLRGEKFTGKSMRPPLEYRNEGDEYFPSLVDINGDGRKELMVTSNCLRKSCWYNIYQRVGKSYREIFFSYEDGKGLGLLNSKHKKHRDLELVTEYTPSRGLVSTYFFTGEYYEPKECFEYQIAENGKTRRSSVECEVLKTIENE